MAADVEPELPFADPDADGDRSSGYASADSGGSDFFDKDEAQPLETILYHSNADSIFEAEKCLLREHFF